jgi:uncharacterized protein YjbJ (UPF0337 family)
MESNRIEGIGHQVKGAVIEGLGKAIGDAKLAADGAAERAIGDEQNVAGAGGDQLIGVDADRIEGIAHQVQRRIDPRFRRSRRKSATGGRRRRRAVGRQSAKRHRQREGLGARGGRETTRGSRTLEL